MDEPVLPTAVIVNVDAVYVGQLKVNVPAANVDACCAVSQGDMGAVPGVTDVYCRLSWK